jgi:molybdopterin adenylyltransferase
MLRVAILVVNSKILSGLEPDSGRKELEQMVENVPGTVAAYEVVADDRKAIRDGLVKLCEDVSPDAILTIGGTGVRPTDWAPEATRDVVEREIPGIGEAMRQESLKKVRTAMLSRGIAGIRGGTFVVNLPGSPRGARENLAVVLPILEHTVEKISKAVKREG